jgi:hypothetical protein
MAKSFKFFKGQSTSPLDAYADRVINNSHYGAYRIGQDEPPFNLSRRHWNLLPQDLRGATLQEMNCYIQGWEASSRDDYNNPYDDLIRAEIWNRGWHVCFDRRNRTGRNFRNVNPNPPIDETYPEFYNTDEYVFFDVTEVRYDEETYVPYKQMLFRHIEEGNTIEGDRIRFDHPMYNFPDIL